jgi:hypothetical protein
MRLDEPLTLMGWGFSRFWEKVEIILEINCELDEGLDLQGRGVMIEAWN